MIICNTCECLSATPKPSSRVGSHLLFVQGSMTFFFLHQQCHSLGCKATHEKAVGSLLLGWLTRNLSPKINLFPMQFPHVFIVFLLFCYYNCPCFFLLCPPPPSPSLRQSPYRCPCPWVTHICSWLTLSPSFIWSPPPSPLTAVSLFHVSTLLFLLFNQHHKTRCRGKAQISVGVSLWTTSDQGPSAVREWLAAEM